MGKTIQLTAADGHKLDAYRADPAGKPKGAVVVIQEIFGVNGHIQKTADGFAAKGYVAIAPALFDRVERGIDLGYREADIAAGRNIRTKIGSDDRPLADIQAAINAVKSAGKVATVGYCWGGSLAFLSATRLNGLACAVGYYGATIAQNAQEKPKAPTLLHFGETDQSIPMADVEKVKKARPDVTIYTYPAGHGFNCDERASYDAASAKTALGRTMAFLAQHVG